jgi:hypothetical protein
VNIQNLLVTAQPRLLRASRQTSGKSWCKKTVC